VLIICCFGKDSESSAGIIELASTGGGREYRSGDRTFKHWRRGVNSDHDDHDNDEELGGRQVGLGAQKARGAGSGAGAGGRR
jgi:hypothetical protein